jgi:small subunit ribosomal protein S17
MERRNNFMVEQNEQSVAQPPSLPTAGQPAAGSRGSRKTRTGQVVSSGMNKTIVVRTVTRVPHAKFGKIVKQVKRFYAHDEEGKAQIGDTVLITETRPLSKLKRWRLIDIIKH